MGGLAPQLPSRAAQRELLLALVSPSGLLSFPSRRWARRSTAAEAAAAGKPQAECPETNRKCGPRRRGGAGGCGGKRGPRGLGGARPRGPGWGGAAGPESSPHRLAGPRPPQGKGSGRAGSGTPTPTADPKTVNEKLKEEQLAMVAAGENSKHYQALLLAISISSAGEKPKGIEVSSPPPQHL